MEENQNLKKKILMSYLLLPLNLESEKKILKSWAKETAKIEKDRDGEKTFTYE